MLLAAGKLHAQTSSGGSESPWVLYIGDTAIPTEAKPVIVVDDRIFMALEAVRILGGELDFDESAKTVYASIAGKDFRLNVSTSKARLDGELLADSEIKAAGNKWYLSSETWEDWGFRPVWHPVFKSWQVIGRLQNWSYNFEAKDFIFETLLPAEIIESQNYPDKTISITAMGCFVSADDLRTFSRPELNVAEIAEDEFSSSVTINLRQSETTGFRVFSTNNRTNHRVNLRNHSQIADFEETSSGEIVIKVKFGKPTEIKTMELTGPDRLVLDFPDSIYTDPTAAIDVGIGRVNKIRIGQFSQPPNPYIVRVVIDLAGKIGYRIIPSRNGDTYYIQFLERRTGKFAIMIDAGHGGSDPGALSRFSDMQEKELNLDIAKRVRDVLESKGQTVIMTRETDIFVTLAERADLANSMLPMFFVSIHNNSIENPEISGAMTFHYSSSAEGKKLATYIQRRVTAETSALDKGVRTANFYVLRETIVPAALVECGFLTNETEEKKLRDPQYRQSMANAIANGILDYCASIARE